MYVSGQHKKYIKHISEILKNTMTKIEIPYSKTKLIIGTIFSFLFVISGFFMMTSISSEYFLYNLFIKTFGILGILFFGTTLGYGVIRLFDKKPGLIIDEIGIIDNSNMSSVGLIEWKEIREIKTQDFQSTSFLLIFLYDNDSYLNRIKGFKGKLLKGNYKKYGTPISIVSNTLDCNFDELAIFLKEKFKEYRI
jgi:hypothetical protein